MIKKFSGFRPGGSIQPYLKENQPEAVSTAFWLLFSALGCDFAVRSVSLNPNGTMGPFLSIMRQMGVAPIKGFSGLKLNAAKLSGLTLDLDESNVDFVPLLCVIASQANGISCFSSENTVDTTGFFADTLKRTAEFCKAVDIDYMYLNDRLLIKGRTKKLKGGIVDCSSDVRFVLAALLASAVCEEEISISYFEYAYSAYPDLEADIEYLMKK